MEEWLREGRFLPSFLLSLSIIACLHRACYWAKLSGHIGPNLGSPGPREPLNSLVGEADKIPETGGAWVA